MRPRNDIQSESNPQEFKKGTLRGSFFGDTSHVEKIFFHFTLKKRIFNSKKDVMMRLILGGKYAEGV